MIRENRFGIEPEITAKVARGKWPIFEVPISYDGRTYQRAKKSPGRTESERWCAFYATTFLTAVLDPHMPFATKLTRPEKLMCLLFLVTLPLINPWVRGDGVGYYAYARAILIQHNLDFRSDWEHANQSFRMVKLDDEGQVRPQEYTRTGYINNHFAMGSALLWMPFLIVAHLGVVLYNLAGGHVAADGFSPPYLTAMALGTATCAFAGLLMAYRVARKPFRGALGVAGHLGHMVREPPASLHVFQSVVFACRIHFQRGVVYFLLGPDAGRPQRTAVDGAGSLRRADDGRVLPECDFHALPVNRIADEVLGLVATETVEPRCILPASAVRPGVLRWCGHRILAFDDRAPGLVRQRF